MQIHLDFKTDMLNVPLAYNAMLHGMIFSVLASADADYATFLHDRGQEENLNRYKLFTFGRLSGEYRINGKEIIFPRRVSLEIRSADERFIQNFLYGCRKSERYKIGTNTVMLENCRLTDKIIDKECVRVRTLSPFFYKAEYPENKIFDAEAAHYKLIDNARKKWIYSGRDENDFRLELEFKNEPKRVLTQFKNIYITSWDSELELTGNISTLNFIYNAGIGGKNSQGFGMFETI